MRSFHMTPILALFLATFLMSDGLTAADTENGPHREKLLAKFDVNKDGKLDQAEREQAAAFIKERRAARFDALDSDHDGVISRAEWDAAPKKHRQDKKDDKDDKNNKESTK